MEIANMEETIQIREKRINRAILVLSTIVYLATAIYGICQLFNPLYARAQAILITVQCFAAMLIPIAFDLLEKLINLKIHYCVRIFILFYAALAMIFGEALRFYYIFSWWDLLLHVLSGFWISFVAFFILLNLTKAWTPEHRKIVCIAVSIMVSLSVAFLWEVYEFTFDTLFGTNMQKFIPEADGLFNGGGSKDFLTATDESIAAFYRTPQGYRFALMDTMKDMICCILGTAMASVGMVAIFKRGKSSSLGDIIQIKRKNHQERGSSSS